jgi:hypothetical protein
MKSDQFRSRFLAALPEFPPELGFDFTAFVQIDPNEPGVQHLKPSDQEMLIEVGLPQDASPFLSFRRSSVQTDYLFPGGGFYLGADGSGNAICVEIGTGHVVLFDHDDGMRPILVNSSLSAFAECLCVYQEHLRSSQMHTCYEAMLRVDPALASHGGFWKEEARKQTPIKRP